MTTSSPWRGLGNRAVRSTYRGLVWETRRGMLGVSRWLAQLVAEWETTSVEFIHRRSEWR